MSKHVETGLFSSLLRCDSKAVGTLYLIFAIVAGVIGAIFSIILRLALNGTDIVFLSNLFPRDPMLLSFMNMAHALILVFFMVMPALIGGFANWFVPIMIGTQNVAFPRLNIVALVLLPFSVIAAFMALFTLAEPNLFKTLLFTSILLGSFSFLFTFVNFISTIITMRAPGLTLSRLPVFVWSVLIASFLGLMSVPAMLAALTDLIYAKDIEIEHLSMMIWFFSHPEVYVLLLPAFGIISQILTTFCRRRLWMENLVIAAMIAIGGIGFILWSQDLFHFLQPNAMERYFSVALPLIIVPTVFILISWFVTLVQSRVTFATPMLWASGFIFVVLMGQISAIQLIASGTGLNELNSSAFVAHFHYILSLSAVFAIFAGWYYWLPKITGYSCRVATIKIHFWMMFIGVNAIFLPQHLHDLSAGYLFTAPQVSIFSSIGAILAGLSVIVFLYGICETLLRRVKVGNNPWGQGAATLEWQLPSPPDKAWVKVPVIHKTHKDASRRK